MLLLLPSEASRCPSGMAALSVPAINISSLNIQPSCSKLCCYSQTLRGIKQSLGWSTPISSHLLCNVWSGWCIAGAMLQQDRHMYQSWGQMPQKPQLCPTRWR